MLLRTTTTMLEFENVMSKYLLLFLMNSSAFFPCSMILLSSLSLAFFSYSLLRSSFSFSILLRFRFI